MDREKYFATSKIKGQRQKAIASETAAALISFCEQEPEFEQAVEQSEAEFQNCLDDIVADVGSSISDIEVFRKAVKFYFSTATVSFIMQIDLAGNNAAPAITMTSNKPVPDTKTLTVSLDDLLDF